MLTTINLDTPPAINLDTPPAPQRRRRGPYGRLLTTAVVVVAAVTLTAYAIADEFRPASRTPSNTAAVPPPVAPEPLPRLVTPASASAGSTFVVLGHHDADLCGRTEIRLDGAPLSVTTIESAELRNHIFISIQMPARTTPGPHRIDLYGPAQAVGGMICGRTPEHQVRIATATINVRTR